jgi:hypothetical protein
VPVVPPSARPSVVVLNQTGVTGLAARVADKLRAADWTVTGIGNWQGNVPSTTVYYPSGAEQSARALASALGQNRIRPRVSGMALDQLTVILAENDPP